MGRLRDKIALVTGAASGIGEKVCELFADEGATVIGVDLSYKPNYSLRTSRGVRLHLDVSNENQWMQLQGKIKEDYSCLDIIVNSAGISGYGDGFGAKDIEDYSLNYWRHLFSINLEGTLLACKYGIPLMRKSKKSNMREGAIINLASRAANIGIPGGEAYAASKAGVLSLTKSVAMYCASKQYKIRCNSVSPDFVDTPLLDFVLKHNEKRISNLEKLSKKIPMGEVTRPIEVAQLILFLASDEARLISGIDVAIDGGVSAGVMSNMFKEGIN